MYFLYTLLLALALILTLPWWLVQMLRSGKYRDSLRERLGRVPSRLGSVLPGGIWIHAVSVGEVLAISRLVSELRAAAPAHRVFISTTTLTGRNLARERFGSENVFYFPLDFPFALRPYFARIRPALFVLAETEFWPNALRIAREHGARIAVVNARISDRSLPRYAALKSLLRRVLQPVDVFLAQTADDALRLGQVGADPKRIHVSGNLKFDVRPPSGAPIVATLKASIPQRTPVLVFGSTVDGEELPVLAAIQQLLREHPHAAFILAPRHPERFPEVETLIREAGLLVVRRSTWSPPDPVTGRVFLLDTIGELASVYSLATVAFVGGSLVPRGGHNILEPAFHSVPIVVGPHTENFREIVSSFAAAQAVSVTDAEHLGEELLRLLADSDARNALGVRAREQFDIQAGATARTLAALSRLLPPAAREASQ